MTVLIASLMPPGAAVRLFTTYPPATAQGLAVALTHARIVCWLH